MKNTVAKTCRLRCWRSSLPRRMPETKAAVAGRRAGMEPPAASRRRCTRRGTPPAASWSGCPQTAMEP